MGEKVESLILQISAERDRGEREQALTAEGFLPFIMFANGPQTPFLLAARPEDVDAAFALSSELAEGLGAERLARRMRVFDQISFAIETDMKYVAEETEFPNAALFLLVEALYQYGFETHGELRPCAVRYLHNNLEEPDFGEAPGEGEEMELGADAATGESEEDAPAAAKVSN